MKSRLIGVAAVLTIVLALAGCGGGGGSTNAKGYESIEEHRMVEAGDPPLVSLELGELLRDKYNSDYGETTGTECLYLKGLYDCDVVNTHLGNHMYHYKIEVDESSGEASIVSNEEGPVVGGPFTEQQLREMGYEFNTGEALTGEAPE